MAKPPKLVDALFEDREEAGAVAGPGTILCRALPRRVTWQTACGNSRWSGRDLSDGTRRSCLIARPDPRPTDQDGHLYVASRGSDAVLRFDGTSGQFIDAFGQPSAASDLFHPTDVAFGPDGHLYVSTLSKKIQRYDGTSGQFIDDFVPATPPPSWPKTLVFGPNGDLWVGAFRVLRYDGASGAFVDYPGGTPTQDARDLFVGPEDALFVSDTETDRIVLYAGGSGSVFVEDLDNGGLDRPWGLAFGPPYFVPQ